MYLWRVGNPDMQAASIMGTFGFGIHITVGRKRIACFNDIYIYLVQIFAGEGREIYYCQFKKCFDDIGHHFQEEIRAVYEKM